MKHRDKRKFHAEFGKFKQWRRSHKDSPGLNFSNTDPAPSGMRIHEPGTGASDSGIICPTYTIHSQLVDFHY